MAKKKGIAIGIERDTLLLPVRDVLGAVEKKVALPILECCLIRAESSALVATATDLEMEFSACREYGGDPFTLCVPAAHHGHQDAAMTDEIGRASDLAEMERGIAVINHARRLVDPASPECVDCGMEIPLQRRVANPRACRCIECQRIQEALLKRAGGER